MGAEVFAPQTNACYLFIDEPRILSGADMAGVIDPTWKDKIVKAPTAVLKPCQHTRLSQAQQLKLNGSTRLLLNYDCASFYATATGDVAYPHLDDIAPSQLAIDGQIKQSAVTQMTFAIE